MADKVAWVTGGASGIGAAVSRRLAQQGYRVLVTDVDVPGGEKVAAEIGGIFRRCDVRAPGDNKAAVGAAVIEFGGLDLAFLNAGVATGIDLEDGFSLETYRRAMAINLDGVVYGAQAALPALRARGGGDIIATASLAGLTAVPFNPIYGANKAAVVGFVRALGPLYAPANIRVNALCPSFAETAIIETVRPVLVGASVPLLEVSDVVAAFDAILVGDGTGEAWYVQAGRPAGPFEFGEVPGAVTGDGRTMSADAIVQAILAASGRDR